MLKAIKGEPPACYLGIALSQQFCGVEGLTGCTQFVHTSIEEEAAIFWDAQVMIEALQRGCFIYVYLIPGPFEEVKCKEVSIGVQIAAAVKKQHIPCETSTVSRSIWQALEQKICLFVSVSSCHITQFCTVLLLICLRCCLLHLGVLIRQYTADICIWKATWVINLKHSDRSCQSAFRIIFNM